jgi:hypothetical protein
LLFAPALFSLGIWSVKAQGPTHLSGVSALNGFTEAASALVGVDLPINPERSQSMAWALKSRSFQMSSRRTYMLETRLSWRDGLALGLAAVLLAGFIELHVLHCDLIPGLII